ncbi:MAG: phosphoribosyl-AMP cyclohydrolase [Chloroflexota bacterium]|nr:phosphoribosyl-AMP cyclohydrolase [Chloroflexota bacterium]
MNANATDSALERLEFDAQGLVPAVVQDANTQQVLMLGFMTKQMLVKTLETGQVWFWSRSRQEPWLKGATSGNYLNVVQVYRNCEENSLLILARPDGPTCHTGAVSCYYRTLDEE